MNDAAAPLVMLPGLLCDRRIFAAQHDRFADAQSINGFGLIRDISAMADHALALAPARMSLLGHSMGARVALEMVRKAPERIARLALVSTGVHPQRPGEAEKRLALLALGREQGAAALVDRWLPPMLAPQHQHDEALMAPLRRMCIDVGVDAFEAQITALLGRPEVESLLASIAMPTLVAVGSQDQWSPPVQHEAIASAIPDSNLVVIDGAGHMLPVEAPDALNSAIAAWLARPALTPTLITGETI